MAGRYSRPTPAWVEPFLTVLRGGASVGEAARQAGIDPSLAYHRRRSHADFRAAYDAIRPVAVADEGTGVVRRQKGAARVDRFLVALAETSNVAAAAKAADVSLSTIYQLRREDPEIARRWYAALAEGYDNLEMELLGRLRGGAEAEKEHGKFDTAAALRCLAAHRESVAREKGRRTLAEEAATIESINAKIDSLRLARQRGVKAIAAARKAKARREVGQGNEA